MSVADLELLERSRITVDDGGGAFRIRGVLIPFDAILHIELSTQATRGTTDVAAWREQRAVARVITDDRLHDPMLMEMGVRASSSDGEPPDFDASLLSARVRRIAEAAARVCGKRVLQK
ncbi:MAG TPA: hypothetical protein VHB97_12945 [Polyangia bacterium]|jgi:hypothetical protein|nr:hypothetical protein [Polyangia bacterium]